MSQNEVAVKLGCKVICENCEIERAPRTVSCWSCGCKETKELCLAFPGEEIIASVNIVKENPPPRLNAASSFS